jgi:hypothetical protein
VLAAKVVDNVVTTLDPSEHSRGIALRLFGVSTYSTRQSTVPCFVTKQVAGEHHPGGVDHSALH